MSKCPYGEYCVTCSTPEPTSPSVYTPEPFDEQYLLSQCRAAAAKVRELQDELILRNQEIEDLQLTNRNLSRKIVEDARKRGEAATQQPSWPRGFMDLNFCPHAHRCIHPCDSDECFLETLEHPEGPLVKLTKEQCDRYEEMMNGQ